MNRHHDKYLPRVHPVVNKGINGGIGHGQPIAGQVDVLDIRSVQDLSVVKGIQEEGLLRQPAQRERHHDHDEHFYYLKNI